MRVLVVEDARPMAEALAKGLREQGYAVDVAGDGETAIQQAEINQYDAIVLDVMLPQRDGFAVCRALREQGLSVPVLMLTARDAVEDRVAGLDVGADDYLTKPFAFKELLARLRALMRRHSQLRPPRLKLADLELDTASQEVRRAGRLIRLTAKEYALLEYLLLHAGEVVSREGISEHVWDESFDPFSNLIEVYIQRLRKKIDEGEQIRLIHTRRGAGYLLCAQDREESAN
ncbi:MAG: response regulator transcription factor [Acidobacteriota bacterium]|jgi:two-component system copper resistance phosphate regulon response regulator CusR